MAGRKKAVAAPVLVEVKANVDAGAVFERVESNIKGGVARTLGPCTAVVSKRNRAGKTAVLDSVRFALTGAHPIGPHYADLCGLTADGAAPWASLSGQKTATTNYPSGKKTPLHDDSLGLTDTQRAHLLPLSSLRDLLTLGTAKAREELFRRFGGASVDIPRPAGLNGEQLAIWQKALGSATSTDPAERLAAAGEWVRKEKRRVSAEVKSLDDERARLQEEVAVEGPVTDDLIREAEEALIAAHKWASAENLRKAKEEAETRLMAAIDAFEAKPKPQTAEEVEAWLKTTPEYHAIATANAALKEAESRLKSAPSTVLYDAVVTLRKLMAEAGDCLVCAGKAPANTAALHTQAVELLAEVEAGNADAKQAFEAALRRVNEAGGAFETVAQDARRTQRSKAQAYGTEAHRLKVMSEEYERLVKLVDTESGETPELTVEAAKEEVERLKRTITKNERIYALGGEIRLDRTYLDEVKTVEGVVSEVSATLLGGLKSKAEAAVNAWMPKGFTASLRVSGDECRWEVIGADGKPHPRGAMSGAEWSALAVAIACAWSDGLPYRFLLLDDADVAGFSAENVKNLLNTVSLAVSEGKLTQAFIAWSRPEEIPSEGWTVVEL